MQNIVQACRATKDAAQEAKDSACRATKDAAQEATDAAQEAEAAKTVLVQVLVVEVLLWEF